MKAVEIILEEAKVAGIKQAEVLIVKAYGAAELALPKIIASPDCSAVEKTVAGFLVPLLAGLKAGVEKLADLNKDGVVG